MGKVYVGKVQDVEYYFNLKTKSKITDIIRQNNFDNNINLIRTNKNSIKLIPNDALIQILDQEENLELHLTNNPNESSPGFGCIFNVESITQGRITSISIENYGVNYLNENRPIVGIKKYKLKNN